MTLNLLLGGCVHFEPQPLDPARQATQIQERTLSDTDLARFVTLHWSGEFPVWPPATWNLQSLTPAAIYFNPDLAVARARLATTTAAETTAGQRPNPTLSVSPAYNSTTFTPSPWLVTATLEVPIETAGKRGYRLATARNLSAAARLNLATSTWEVRARLRKTLVESWAALEAIRLLGEQLAAQTTIVQLMEGQMAAGAATPIEVTKERIAQGQIQLAALDAHNHLLQARTALAGVLGVPPGTLVEAMLDFNDFSKPSGTIPSAEAQRRALLGRSDVLAALAEYAASESALQLEIAKQYPDIHLSPGYEFDQGDNKWGLGATVELPVFHHNRGPIAEAEANRRELAAHFEAVQLRVMNEIAVALTGYDTAGRKLVATTAWLGELDRQAGLVQSLFDAGAASRQAVAAAHLERTTAALAELDARIKLQEALGQLEDALQSPVHLPASLFPSPALLPTR